MDHLKKKFEYDREYESLVSEAEALEKRTKKRTVRIKKGGL